MNDDIDSSSSDNLVKVESLASSIRDFSSNSGGGEEITEEQDETLVHPLSAANHRESSRSISPLLDCIYVDRGQYYDQTDKHLSSTNWKVVKKTTKVIVQRTDGFLSALVDPTLKKAGDPVPIFAVTEISFLELREFGTYLMKRESEHSTSNACIEVAELYPSSKRALKTLGAAIDSYMKRKGFWTSSSQARGKRLSVQILLYSTKDDRFDMVTLESGGFSDGVGTSHGKGRRK